MLWSSLGDATVLHDIGGQGNSDALALNNAGYSAGYSDNASGGAEAVMWSPKGRATKLPGGVSDGDAEAVAINASGECVGYYTVDGGATDAALWVGGRLTRLADILGPAWSDTQATGINKVGDIVGYGDYQGSMSAFLLMNIYGASSDRFDAVVSHTGLASALAAAHDHLRS